MIPRLAAVLLVLVLVLAGGWYVLQRDDSDVRAAPPVPSPAVASTPKQVEQILRATDKQTRTKVTVRSGRSAISIRVVDTAKRVVASSPYDKDRLHYRYLQLDDDVYSYVDGRSCYLHAKQPWKAPVDSPTSGFLPSGRPGIGHKVSEASGKTNVVWSYTPDRTRPATATGTVVADSDTHLMRSASGEKSVAGTAVISYGAAVALPGKPGNMCKSRR